MQDFGQGKFILMSCLEWRGNVRWVLACVEFELTYCPGAIPYGGPTADLRRRHVNSTFVGRQRYMHIRPPAFPSHPQRNETPRTRCCAVLAPRRPCWIGQRGAVVHSRPPPPLSVHVFFYEEAGFRGAVGCLDELDLDLEA